MSYDVIGDIHGQATKLRALLSRLGYRERGGAFRQPERTAVFLGDFIDRGPEQVDVTDIVRRMVDAGSAQAVLGNHEFNAIGWASPDPATPGEALRRHTPSNRRQHGEFLRQVGEGSPLHRELVAWFKTLPLFLDLGGIRAVHAWWRPAYAAAVTRMTSTASARREFFIEAYNETSDSFRVTEGLLKGLETELPAGHEVVDDAGIRRHKVRVKWWLDRADTLGDLVLMVPGHSAESLRRIPVPPDLPLGLEGDVPVFIGHYWFSGEPRPLAPNLACLDYSIGRNGPLVGYRWEGETSLRAQGFVAQP